MQQTVQNLIGRIEVDRMVGVGLFNEMGERHGSKTFLKIVAPKIRTIKMGSPDFSLTISNSSKRRGYQDSLDQPSNR